jgi:hypothetical protein
MNCPYCQCPCTAIEDVRTSYPGWLCAKHPHLVQLLEVEPGCYALTYSVSYHRRIFFVEVYKLPNNNICWSLREGSKVAVKFDYIPPQLTPDNIDQRLPTLLVFS